MTHLPLNALRAFEAVARTGSFRAAADSLCVTQSAISHQIRHLEQWIGAPLFDRTGRVPRLMPRGEALARDLTTALDGIDAACRRARPATESDALVVAAIPSVAVCWLIPRLPAFRALHPDIPLRIIYAHHGQDIDFTGIDLAFVFADRPPGRPGIRSQTFLPGRSVPVGSPAILEDMPPVPLLDWLLEKGLLHDSDQTGWRTWLARVGQPVPERLPGAVFQDFNLLRIAALSGQGIALCSLAMIGADLAQGRLVQLSDVEVMETFDYWLIQSDLPPRDPPRQRARQLFLSWIMQERLAG